MAYPKISLVLRDQSVTVTGIVIAPAEPEIGIFSAHVEDFTLKAEDGSTLEWELTSAESSQVTGEIWAAERESEWPEEDGPG